MMTNVTHTTDRREVLIGGAAVLASAVALGPAAAQPTAGPTYAVFTEFSPDSKLMKGGWNTRVFTDTDIRKGSGIQCDFATGIITLAPGSYHITALSIACYYNSGEPPETATIHAPASAGYCRLRIFDPNAIADSSMRGIENSAPSIICIGSPSSANLTPSLLETYYETDRTAQILLEHQSGTKPEQIYLRVFSQDSRWHAMARISIRQL